MWKAENNRIAIIFFLLISFHSWGQIKYSPNEKSPKGEVEHYIEFSLSYSEGNEQPYWVAYELTQKELEVKRSRTNHFRADKNISTGSASLNDYKHRGFDRGHITRASFCKGSEQGYKESYLLSNMSPQQANVNRVGKVWYRIEDAEMYFAYALDNVFSASGPIFKDNLKTIGKNKVTVPGYFYKVILSGRMDQAIGFIIPHKPSSKNIFEFAVSVDQVEKETGIDFFHQLSNNKERKLEANLDLDFWRKQYKRGKEEKRNPGDFVPDTIPIASDDDQVSHSESQSYKVISWNVESGGAHKDTIATTIDVIKRHYGEIDIWGFSEIKNHDWANTFRDKLGDNYRYQLGSTGRSDRLAIIYNKDRFEKVGDMMEFDDINPGGRVRAPIALKLKDKKSNQELIFMVNHLYRGNARARQEQAGKLQKWVQTINIPVIAVGDYNFDYDIPSNDGNRAFDIFTDDDHFIWIEPEHLIRTQCSMNFNSILDFVFVNDDASIWDSTKSEIFIMENDCEKSEFRPDHRPVFAELTEK